MIAIGRCDSDRVCVIAIEGVIGIGVCDSDRGCDSDSTHNETVALEGSRPDFSIDASVGVCLHY